MKLSDLNFTVELKSSGAHIAKFPNSDVVGVALNRPDPKASKYKMKILIPEAACKKAQMKPAGFVMAKISDCSNGIQLLYQEQQGANFKGYTLRPLGAYKTVEALKEYQKTHKSLYMNSFVELTIPFELLDTVRSQKFDNKFVDILATGKHNIVIDATKLSIYVAK